MATNQGEYEEPLKVTKKTDVEPVIDLDPAPATATPATPQVEGVDPALQKQADELIDKLYTLDLKDLRAARTQATAVQRLGSKVQEEMVRKSAMLKQPMGKLMQDAEDGGPVAQNLLDLQRQVNEINPNMIDFSVSGFRRLISWIPGVGTPLANWMQRYQSVEGTMNDIVAQLQDGRAQLERDNITLQDDQLAMRELTLSLQEYVRFGQLLDQKLAARVESDSALSEDRQKFLQEEVLFPLRQRLLDLQQQLAVNQQGVITAETIVRNNRELIRGVSRAINVTVPALSTAATFALAAQTQKQVLRGVEAVNKTTDTLIQQTAEKLKTQGVEIQKQASRASLDVDGLKKAFANVQGALDDISRFRQEALPEMAQSILEMDELTDNMESSIRRMEEGQETREEFDIVITDEKA